MRISREYVIRARDAIIKSESKEAIKYLKKGNQFLISLLQVASGELTEIKDYEIIEQIICSEISKMEFFVFIIFPDTIITHPFDSDILQIYTQVYHFCTNK